MSYNGLEIDMFSLGDADSILVTKWADGIPVRVLIDGGKRNSYAEIRLSLKSRDIKYIDHVVSSHPHDDHVGGLLELVEDRSFRLGTAWVHIPGNHVDMTRVRRALRETSVLKHSQLISASLVTSDDLVRLLMQRGIRIQEPFAGKEIGFLTVCGPSESYYENLLREFADTGAIRRAASAHANRVLSELLSEKDNLLSSPETSHENNSSVILGTRENGALYLFTADAGKQALEQAVSNYTLEGLRWMQLPHHGSRRNITQGLVEYFRPMTAFVSASGSKKHPRRAVVNEFKRQGTSVYSTHYPNGGNLWHHNGEVPERPDYSSATPLWEANN